MEFREKLIDIAKRYSDMICREFSQEVGESIKINVYISGSVSYGYCDEKSDIELEFYLPKVTSKEIKDKLKKIIDSHPKFEDIRMSAGVSEWPLEKIANGDINDFWDQSFIYLLYELTHAIPIREDFPLIADVESKIGFYPQETLQKIIKGLWLTIGDNGTYNAQWSFSRGQKTSSYIFLYMSIEALLRLAYLLNNQYFPHTKWLEKELDGLQNDFGLKKFVEDNEGMDLETKLKTHHEIVHKMDVFMSDNSVLSQKLIDDPWSVVHEDYYVFNPMRFGCDELKR